MEDLVQAMYDSDVMLYPTFHHGRRRWFCSYADAVAHYSLKDATGQRLGRGRVTVPLSVDEPPVEGLARSIRDLDANDLDRRAGSYCSRHCNAALHLRSSAVKIEEI